MLKDYINRLMQIGSEWDVPPADGYYAGEVTIDGKIRLEKWSAVFGWDASYGQVCVTKNQAIVANHYGWKTVGDKTQNLVIVER